jgi:RsiW-degrading membrane proteinase PrsW (M82 family)
MSARQASIRVGGHPVNQGTKDEAPKRPGGDYRPNPADRGGQPSQSELLPLGQKLGQVTRRPFFVPAIATIIVVLVLIASPTGSQTSMIAMGLFLLAALGWAMYKIIGKPAAWWAMPAVAGVVAYLVSSKLMGLFQGLYMSAGVAAVKEPGFAKMFYMLFRAALPEETIKAIPIVIGVYLAHKVLDRASAWWQFRVAEPLDGMFIGAASGLGFSFQETVFQYAPRAGLGGGETLFMRVLSELFGHVGWSAILGYFIGLAVLRPENRVKTIATGFAIAVLLHAAWNGLGGGIWMAANAVISTLLVLTLAAKAREISPNRDALAPSQIVAGFSQLNPLLRGAAPAAAAARAPAATPFMAEPLADADVLVIQLGASRMPATPGARVYESQTPGLHAAATDGIVAEVQTNPNDPSVLGIKNRSTAPWIVVSADGARRELAPGRTTRIVRGTRVELGDAVAEIK